ncbi:Indigoidine synthase A like protein-domain-containing protein [Kockovaella imperatae]|uniref:Indigoidine synthase A like protein-domain-containing protein n=1 Tax=Kockovaella imperatae TaxID=4999 RepID=A0A1Y1UE94_9TREE|nr:Indigoidine synthase A like protein-domain-containing protein [Kockovaella imperatae]ORX36363.1 Indigoidine synthase A like protein-domain-containing protein [Kockovaella imperatae]
MLISQNGRLCISEEVEEALCSQRSIVALESAIVTHGMPHSTNLETASSLEAILRSKGVIPATIALIDGSVHVGLSNSQMARLADSTLDTGRKVKVSRRDLAPALSLGLSGGTTVSGTMYIAHSVGVQLFVTGGIGGVHRGAEKTFDISADLLELGRTPVGVICAGAKSILDIPRTLEVLETNGVCVSTFGRTKDFPAFYSPVSGVSSPWNAPDSNAAAKLIRKYCGLTLPQPLSTLLAVPIPSEHKVAGDRVQKLVEQAITESADLGIKGNEVTPWLLKRVGELSGGETLRLIGAEVAIELSKMSRQHDASSPEAAKLVGRGFAAPNRSSKPSWGQRRQYSSSTSQAAELSPPTVIVIGSAALDITSSASVPIAPKSTTPGEINLTPGGVARNIAESAQRFLSRHAVQLISAIGTEGGEVDAAGVMLLHEMRKAGLRTDGIQSVEGVQTASCSLVLNERRDLVAGVADMGIVEKIDIGWIHENITEHRPKLVAFDCNTASEVLAQILELCLSLSIKTFCDPTSIAKASRLVQAAALVPSGDRLSRSLITHIAPNVVEAPIIARGLRRIRLVDWSGSVSSSPDEDSLDSLVMPLAECLSLSENVWIKSGPKGLIHARLMTEIEGGHLNPVPHLLRHPWLPDKRIGYWHYGPPAVAESEIVSTTGAGDTLAGGIIAGLIGDDETSPESLWVARAIQAAGLTMKSRRAVG